MKNNLSRYSMRSCVLEQKNQVVTPDLEGFAERWQIQNVFSKIATEPEFLTDAEKLKLQRGDLPRICNCMRTPIDGDVNLMITPGNKVGHYQHLQTCGSAYGCPICAPKITEYRAAEITHACEQWITENENRCFVMVTFTIPHYIFQRFGNVRSSFMAMKRGFRRQNEVKKADIVPFKRLCEIYKIKHDVTAMDFTYSSKNGWHVHSHDLYFLDRKLDDTALNDLQRFLTDGWIYQTTKPSCKIKIDQHTADYMRLYSVDVRLAKTPADYISKFGSEVYEKNRELFNSQWGAAQEITKSHLKTGKSNSMTPWDFARIILNCKNDRSVFLFFGRLVTDFVKGMAGRQMVFWRKGSKKYFNLVDKSDQEIAESKDGFADFVMNLSKSDWSIIKKFDARAHVAILAGSHDAIYIKNWIYQLIQ